MGHEVTVVSCVPHHPMGKAYPGFRNKFYHVENVDGIKAIKIWTYITANEGFVKRTFNYVFYMFMAVLAAPFLGKADVVISTSPQFFNGLAGYFVSRMKRAPWLLEIRDLWPESIVAVGAVKNKKIIAVLEAIERFVYRKADHIVSVTKAFKPHIIARGGREEHISVIRNGVDFKFFNSEQGRDEAFAEAIGIRGKFVASYVGTHGMAHGLDVIPKAAALLKHRDDIVFLMAGDGSERERIEATIKDHQLTNVLILGQRPKTDMPKLWSVSDVSLVLLRRLDLFLTVIPSKIFESMAMKKPIILGVQGESAEIIERAGAGVTITPEDPQALADAIERLADDTKLAEQYANQGYAHAREHFDRNKLAQRLESVLLSLANDKVAIPGESKYSK